MPTLTNNLPASLAIEGADGHTYHIDGRQSIEISDADAEAMLATESVRMYRDNGGISIDGHGAEKSEAEPYVSPKRAKRGRSTQTVSKDA